MLNSIIDGIAIKLNAEFGDGFTIYTESIPQGFQEPCFFISVLKPSKDQVIGSRYLMKHPFDIHFFPSDDEKNSKIYETLGRLNDALELITVDGDLIRGTKISGEIVDDVLHFFVNYDFHVLKVETPEDSMDELAINSEMKG